MHKEIKKRISRLFCGNIDLNRKALKIKKSWDEVSVILDRMAGRKRR